MDEVRKQRIPCLRLSLEQQTERVRKSDLQRVRSQQE